MHYAIRPNSIPLRLYVPLSIGVNPINDPEQTQTTVPICISNSALLSSTCSKFFDPINGSQAQFNSGIEITVENSLTDQNDNAIVRTVVKPKKLTISVSANSIPDPGDTYTQLASGGYS